MSNLTVGQKVCIPTRKSAGGADIDDFKNELVDVNYTKPYLIIDEINEKEEIVTLEFEGASPDFRLIFDMFAPSDLTPYAD